MTLGKVLLAMGMGVAVCYIPSSVAPVVSENAPEATRIAFAAAEHKVPIGLNKWQQRAYRELVRRGDVDQWPYLNELWRRESNWRPEAQNPTSTAYGIAQFLNGTWQGVGCVKTPDGNQQVLCGIRYIYQRFGSPEKALEHHDRHNWY